ncbi:MAG: peptidase S41 [Prevotella sp.]|jgi:C-terminal processing protease CtpA/Prc|nr:peptidase S41 [Prevotella sp.]
MKNTVLVIIFAICILLSNALTAQDKMPGREQRIYTLSEIWKELHYNFAFPENLKKANIDSLYVAYLPKVEQVKDNYEYFRVLSSFIAHFNEAHTRIYADERPDDAPPIKAMNYGERIVVSDIAQNMADKIPIGSEILKIDRIPVVEYIRDSVSPYISAATPHWKFDKSVLELFNGKPQSVVEITVRTPKGEVKDMRMVRNFAAGGGREVMADKTVFSPVNIRIIDKNIGYIQLNSFMGGYTDTINKVFNSYLPQLRNCKGLIIDVRGNRGGSDGAWENMAYHLMPQTEFNVPARYYSRINVAAYKNWGQYRPQPQLKAYYEGTSMEEITHSLYQNKLADSLKLHQPVILVSGHHVGSASEDFVLLMKDTKRAVVVGEPTVGCVGEPMFLPLPDGFSVMMCVKNYVRTDGSQPNDTGILPDIEVERDYNAYLKGKDNILERAIEELKKRMR